MYRFQTTIITINFYWSKTHKGINAVLTVFDKNKECSWFFAFSTIFLLYVSSCVMCCFMFPLIDLCDFKVGFYENMKKYFEYVLSWILV